MPRKYSGPVYGHDLPWWVYDIAIGAMLFGALLAGEWWLALERYDVAALCGGIFSVISYGSFVEPRRLVTRRYEIGTGERALTFAFISDIHVGPYKGRRWVERIVARAHALKPDLILLGGDYLHREAKALPALEPLKTLKAPLGVFAVMGNHDEVVSSKEAHAWFAASGIPLLENRSARPKEGVSVAGADDDWYGETELEAAFKDIPPDDLAVAMLHNPDLAPHAAKLLAARPGRSVMISGHTHGGQIRLPLLGAVPSLPHHLGRKYDKGLFAFEGVPLVIGAGVGESGPRARLFCPPEIVLVTMRY